MLTNLVKALVSTVATPVAIVADILTLPASSYDAKDPFGYTAALVKNAKACFNEAVRPAKELP